MKSISRYLALEGNIRVLAAQTLISQIGFGMLYPIWQAYLISTGISLSQLGLIQTMINVSTGLGLFAWGYVSDHYGRKPVVIASSVCRVVAVGVLIVSESYLALMVFAFFIGFSALFMMANPARSALIAESVETPQRATALSTLMAISQGTSTLMASAGGYIALTGGYSIILYVTLVTEILGVILLLLYIKETLELEDNGDASEPLTDRISGAFVPEKENLPLYIIMFIQGFGYAVAYSLFYGALTDFYGFTTLELGLMTSGFNLVWAVGSIPFGKLADRKGRKWMMMGSLIMAQVSVLGFIAFKSVAAFIFFNGVSAIDICFWIPSWTSLISETVPQERRSSVMGKIDAYGRISAIPAPWLAGLLLENYGFRAPLYVQVFTLMLSMVTISRIREPSSA
ncbi:MAG: MFS transporter [Candidatus Bathyarchaeota archaeon]|nr:MFS transporter [Candidatus Bathyarchaeota archaeon]